MKTRVGPCSELDIRVIREACLPVHLERFIISFSMLNLLGSSLRCPSSHWDSFRHILECVRHAVCGSVCSTSPKQSDAHKILQLCRSSPVLWFGFHRSRNGFDVTRSRQLWNCGAFFGRCTVLGAQKKPLMQIVVQSLVQRFGEQHKISLHTHGT